MNTFPQGFAAPASPATTRFASANSPGPMDVYTTSNADSIGYVQATSPQPNAFPIAVSRVSQPVSKTQYLK